MARSENRFTLFGAMRLPNGLVDGHELRAVGKGGFDLDVRDHFRDAVHHVLACQECGADLHQFGDAAAIARALEKEPADRFPTAAAMLEALGAPAGAT